jgi:hypothetical protein
MSSKKKRQTMEKLRREQMVRKRREDKLQRKADARAVKAADALDQTSPDVPVEDDRPGGHILEPLTATVEPTKNGSGLREAPSPHVHQQ